MRKALIGLALLALTLQTATAQRAKKRVVKKAKVEKPQPQIDPELEAKLEKMKASTQKILVFDSVVVDKDKFLEQYGLSPEIGSISRYGDFFNADGQPNAYVYTGENKTKCYFSLEDDEQCLALYSSLYIDKEWTNTKRLEGLNDDDSFVSMNYPFVMSDGLTLYFAATGSDALGGYDLYVTRYSSDRGQFLTPENVGMPFNSTANDYMLVIDDINRLGWFASDRNQPEGKVCIYKFIPTDIRENYDPVSLSQEELDGLANLSSIADTWKGRSAERQAALDRLAKLESDNGSDVVRKTNGMFLVINDNHVYTDIKQFRNSDNINRYKKLVDLQSDFDSITTKLDDARKSYSTAGKLEREETRADILRYENLRESLVKEINDLRKQIVNSENRLLGTNK